MFCLVPSPRSRARVALLSRAVPIPCTPSSSTGRAIGPGCVCPRVSHQHHRCCPVRAPRAHCPSFRRLCSPRSLCSRRTTAWAAPASVYLNNKCSTVFFSHTGWCFIPPTRLSGALRPECAWGVVRGRLRPTPCLPRYQSSNQHPWWMWAMLRGTWARLRGRGHPVSARRPPFGS